MTEDTTVNGRKFSKITPLDNVAFVNDDGQIGLPDNLGKTKEKEKKEIEEKDISNDLPPVNFFKLVSFKKNFWAAVDFDISDHDFFF